MVMVMRRTSSSWLLLGFQLQLYLHSRILPLGVMVMASILAGRSPGHQHGIPPWRSWRLHFQKTVEESGRWSYHPVAALQTAKSGGGNTAWFLFAWLRCWADWEARFRWLCSRTSLKNVRASIWILSVGSPCSLALLKSFLASFFSCSLMSFSFLLLLRYSWVPGTVFLGKETLDAFTENSVLGLWGALSKSFRNKHFREECVCLCPLLLGGRELQEGFWLRTRMNRRDSVWTLLLGGGGSGRSLWGSYAGGMLGACWEEGRCEVGGSGTLATNPESRGWVIFLQVALFFKWVSSLRNILWHFGHDLLLEVDLLSRVFFDR